MATKKVKRAKKKPVEGLSLRITEPKNLCIMFNDDNIPSYEFRGEGWTGKDIAVVRHHIGRQYKIHQRAVKRSLTGGNNGR